MKQKRTIKLNESQLRKMINESLNEFIRGIRPGARYGNKNFNVKTLINEVEITLNEIDRQCDYLIKLSSQLPGDVFNNNFDSELNRYAGNIGALNQELINKFWESIKGVQINESKLRNIIKESIKKVLKENVKTDIFTIDAFDIQDEESVDVMRYTGVDYESEEEAISAARELAQSLSSWDNVVIVSVYAGQYNDGKGNVFGEPFDIYAISNKDKNTTMIARKNAGYASLEVDEYIGN